MTQPRLDCIRSRVALNDFSTALGFDFMDKPTTRDEGNKKRARGNVPCSLGESQFETATLLREAGDGFGFRIVNVEDGHQLGDLQDFLEFAAEMAQAQPGALRFCAMMGGYKRAQPGAVDKRNVVHVEDNFLFSRGDEALHFFA